MKKIPLVILLILTLVIIVAVVSMLQPTEKLFIDKEEAFTEDATIGWETFNHPFYNFKIDFPSGWQGGFNNYVWAPGSIGLSDEVFAFCPPDHDNEMCTSGTTPGGPIIIDGPILLFVCVEGSWKTPDEKCKTEEEFSTHYYDNIWKPKLEEAVKTVNLSYWSDKRTLRAELILFDSAYETVFNNMVLSFKENITEELVE